MDLERFVSTHLPHPGCRVLEIGCGTGELARTLAEQGFEMTAVDPEAPDDEIFRRTSIEEFSEPGPFDAVVASRSLHHVADFEAAMKKIHALLRSEGVIVLNEFAWEQTDEKTAQWYLTHVDSPGPEDESLLPEKFPAQWVAEHEGLHDSKTMRRILDSHFEEHWFEWVPYMTVYYLKRPDLFEEERALIESGEINALGFRYVGISK